MKIRNPGAWTSTSLATIAAAGLLSGAAWVNADQSRESPLGNLSPQQQEAIDSAYHLSSMEFNWKGTTLTGWHAERESFQRHSL
jgi:hypothetical protein